MGCGNTKQIDAAPPPPNVPRPQVQAVRPVEIGHANDPVAALEFELSTPMLAMPFLRFKKQGRIYKSTKTWRDEALSKGWLVKHDKASGKDRDLCVAHLVGPRIHRRDERCDGPVRPGCA